MWLCAITDRRSLPEGQSLLDLVAPWADGGVDFIQIREKDQSVAELMSLIGKIRAMVAAKQSKLLINLPSPGLASAAVAAGADGVHLAGRPTPGAVTAVRKAFLAAGRQAILSLPCHSLEEVDLARKEEADLILFSPVFEKSSATPQGLKTLRAACLVARTIPVLALGGVTAANAADCQDAGAAGVAGIRLFADGTWRRLTPRIEPYIVE